MNPVKLIFRILSEFSLLDADDYAKYKQEAAEWWSSIRVDNETPDDQKDWRYHLKKKTSVWYVAVGIACLYFPLKRWLSDMISDEPELETED